MIWTKRSYPIDIAHVGIEVIQFFKFKTPTDELDFSLLALFLTECIVCNMGFDLFGDGKYSEDIGGGPILTLLAWFL